MNYNDKLTLAKIVTSRLLHRTQSDNPEIEMLLFTSQLTTTHGSTGTAQEPRRFKSNGSVYFLPVFVYSDLCRPNLKLDSQMLSFVQEAKSGLRRYNRKKKELDCWNKMEHGYSRSSTE